MKRVVKIAVLAIALTLSGCALFRSPPLPGATVDEVVDRLGPPADVYADPDAGRVFAYPQGPYGQTTYMARFGRNNLLQSYEQVLTNERFASIKVDRATKDDVLRTIGRPAERSYLPLRDYEVWSYRYKESGVWNSMMHVHFDREGIVRMMQNGPDPMYDDRKFFR